MAELSALRRIENVVRLGRVEAIEPTRIVLEQGAIAHGPDSLIVDCSANGIPPPPVMPVFAGNRINLLMVGTCQPVFSAALIAYVESHIADEIEKNTLCRVVPSPVLPLDWLRMWAVFLDNGLRWGRHRGLTRWLLRSRLNGLMAMMFGLKKSDEEKQALLRRYRAGVQPAIEKLAQLLAAPPSPGLPGLPNVHRMYSNHPDPHSMAER